MQAKIPGGVCNSPFDVPDDRLVFVGVYLLLQPVQIPAKQGFKRLYEH
jgi:hypothetical protein